MSTRWCRDRAKAGAAPTPAPRAKRGWPRPAGLAQTTAFPPPDPVVFGLRLTRPRLGETRRQTPHPGHTYRPRWSSTRCAWPAWPRTFVNCTHADAGHHRRHPPPRRGPPVLGRQPGCRGRRASSSCPPATTRWSARRRRSRAYFWTASDPATKIRHSRRAAPALQRKCAEHLLEHAAAGADRILDGSSFSSSPIIEVQAVQRLARHVLLDVGVLLPDQAHAGRLAGHRVVLLSARPDLFGRLGRPPAGIWPPNGVRVFSAKKLVTEVSPPVRILLGVAHTFMDFTALTSKSLPMGIGGLRRPVHRRHQLVNPLALAQGLEQLGGVVQETGQRNPNFRVAQESIRSSPAGSTAATAPFSSAAFSPCDACLVGQVVERQCAWACCQADRVSSPMACRSSGGIKLATIHG
jgi:hypothetical protein